ncbi:HemK2/MTQ2 family protein methyltransferase [Methanogenium organophilum]|uniref:Class I SAM-dependent methyltransferase n=1 Tax=Methanogenium organophilum TaxID=2199 RepID=A0A9X9S2U5_METOG|nr:HemK2/MTQ2 family protein methyltransferase [Methanogenium organophilum]WAI00706.1 class I SAM-dependent methyltransferase [Methanogenium organophilum]
MNQQTPEYHEQVYQPEADTYLLLSSVQHEIRDTDLVLEVGTGSGIIAQSCSEHARCVATDVNPHACKMAHYMGVEVVRTDLYTGLKGPFDLIIFNPPYLPTQENERINDWLEYALDGGRDGRAVIHRFASGLHRILHPYGRALLLVSSLTGIEETRKLFAEEGFLSFIVAEETTEGERLVVFRITHDLCSLRDQSSSKQNPEDTGEFGG